MIGPEQTKKKVTIVGDTSKFHLGSKLNYSEFRNLIQKKYDIVQDIPYDAFVKEFIDFPTFFDKIKKSHWWKGIEDSDILIVHGEGLTEKCYAYVYPYLYFSKISKELGTESWLVNFSMYEGEPFLDLLKQFSYMACRDVLTKKHLQKLGFDPALSFDCCISSSDIQSYIPSDGHIAAIRGRKIIDDKILEGFDSHVKYNCCWKWNDGEKVLSSSSLYDYTKKIRKAKFALTTSFHGGIISFLSGVPFVSLDHSNKKFLALDLELLPSYTKNVDLKNYEQLVTERERKKVHKHFVNIYDTLRKRTLLNCL